MSPLADNQDPAFVRYQKLSELKAQGLISQEDFNRRVGGNNL